MLLQSVSHEPARKAASVAANVETYLQVRAGTFYFRRAVPDEARHAFDGKREYYRSLKTKDRSMARVRAAQHLIEYERRLQLARPAASLAALPPEGAAEPAREDLEAGVRVWLSHHLDTVTPSFGRRVRSSSTVEERAAEMKAYEKRMLLDLDAPEPPLSTVWMAEAVASAQGWMLDRSSRAWGELCNLVARAELEFARQAPAVLEGREAVAKNPLFAPERYEKDRQHGTSRLTIAMAIEGFLSDPRLKAGEKTRAMYRQNLASVCEALNPNRRIASVTRQDCRRLRDELICKLPRHRKLRYPGLTIREAITAAQKDGAPLIDAKTQNCIIDNVFALFKWAVAADHRPDNPAQDLRVAETRERKRRPFTIDELQRLFTAPLFNGCVDDEQRYATPGPNHPRRHRFWLPLLGAFTGMRLNEICQLRTDDIEEVGGIWVIHVRPDASLGKSVKTLSSIRRVPIHSELLRIGFVDYVCGLKSSWVFPAIDRSGNEGGSDAQSKWFARFLEKVGLTDKGAVFHSFRHGFRDALREGDVSEEQAFRLGGWTDTKIGNGYGKGQSLSNLKQAIEKLHYPDLNLRHLHGAVNSGQV